MLKLEQSDGGTSYYVANGPLTYRDIAILRKHPHISLMCGKCRMWWQGNGYFLFNNRGHGGDKRVPYDASDPTSLDALNAAWSAYVSMPERSP